MKKYVIKIIESLLIILIFLLKEYNVINMIMSIVMIVSILLFDFLVIIKEGSKN